jgi:tRNA-dihydrouridine synthase
MLGREAVRRPWIFALIRGQAQDPTFSLRIDLEETALAMLDLLRRWLPPVFHVSRARRFFQYFSENLAFGHHLRFSIQNADSLDSMAELVRGYFAEVPAERIRHEN